MSRRSSAVLPPRPTRTFGAAAVGVLALTNSLATTTNGEEDFVIQPQTVLYGAPGSVSTVATETVPHQFVGKSCEMRVTTENNSSVHPGTSVIFTSGPSSITVNGVENSVRGGLLSSQTLVLGSTIVVDVKLGPDGSSSMGFRASFDCTPAVAPAGASSGTSTTAAPSTTAKPRVAGVVTSNPSTTTSTSTSTTASSTASTAAVRKVPSVLGTQQAASLPRTPAAKATVASPNFTG
jgi:hypothetical protein